MCRPVQLRCKAAQRIVARDAVERWQSLERAARGCLGETPHMGGAVQKRINFHLILIKPTHYDDDGYPITWLRSHIPSNTLAALYGLG